VLLQFQAGRRGRAGAKRSWTSTSGNWWPYRDQDVAPRDGLNVVLTLDAGLQNIVEASWRRARKAHSPISISCIMVRPRTGEILAMATLPNFDPNHPGAFPMDALRNRVISDVAEPGSTFKIVVGHRRLERAPGHA
jgi:cell division protein FtsI/penicillin-binding protein 2